MRAAIENFIFDLDGTLVDSLPGIEDSVRFAVSSPIPSLRSLIGPPIRSILRSIRPDVSEGELDSLTRRFRSAYDATGWYNTIPQSGAAELLAELRKLGRRSFLATNKPAAPAAKILSLLEIARYFEGIFARDSRHPPFASKTEMLQALVQRHRLDPTRCLMVGDTAEDYASAVAAGMDVLIVANGYGKPSDIPAGCRLENLNGLMPAACFGQAAYPSRGAELT